MNTTAVRIECVTGQCTCMYRRNTFRGQARISKVALRLFSRECMCAIAGTVAPSPTPEKLFAGEAHASAVGSWRGLRCVCQATKAVAVRGAREIWKVQKESAAQSTQAVASAMIPYGPLDGALDHHHHPSSPSHCTASLTPHMHNQAAFQKEPFPPLRPLCCSSICRSA
ncbi:hypothetical protein MN608_09544 [Microdochium nivale]|nr:hypothetical protein MN608_09544 [Microdochium nivale]